MSTPPDPQREHPSTYVVQDRASEEEMRRLQLQDRMSNLSMGGLLPEQSCPERFHSVLDVGCGTGGWLIELAKTYPRMSRLVGVDVSGKMLDFAREQAAAEGVSDRVDFLIMDALRMLEFPGGSFDLVNQRFGIGWLRIWDWPKLLQEYLRVARLEGVIRITEGDVLPGDCTSPALMQLSELLSRAFFHAGHFLDPTGLTARLAPLLSQHGVQNVQVRAYSGEYRAGTAKGQLYIEDMIHLFRTIKPFLQKWIRLPDDYEAIYQRMICELNRQDFVVTLSPLTAWGNKL